jgi:hypothetical protein
MIKLRMRMDVRNVKYTQNVVGMFEARSPLSRPRRRGYDNIKM